MSGYSSRATPLTDLLKKNKPWVWSEACQLAFEDLKAAVSMEPVLALPNFEKMFELHMDASDFAIGGVLMQEGHPISFESRKLNETERRYTVQEKEMTAIVHCLRIWRHYLLGSRFMLAEISLAKGNVHEKINEGLKHDPMAKELMRLAKEGKTRQFWVEDGLLYTKGRRLYVPKWGNLWKDLIRECHDTKWTGHPGQKRTMALLETSYFWPQMKDGVEVYVRT
ncbi:hypothetical protein BUALT_Bualt12G0115600 [Buddleja alternifolia]|uniref:Reverse transcriptase/retrotransposon-derived protein RNase H-like domain-containing protein n=1 Tax=Buddleja alternifolia TaxID=168488 RepID=A0AAV6WYJ1_9LAMI|nr:hypothetical protein BUALT_Bualt12G0115600 [Buddleja alternifolia]